MEKNEEEAKKAKEREREKRSKKKKEVIWMDINIQTSDMLVHICRWKIGFLIIDFRVERYTATYKLLNLTYGIGKVILHISN